jgi:putative sterol carrier protein
MEMRKALTREQVAARVAFDPVLTDFIAPWRIPVTKGGLAESFKGIADGLRKSKRSASVQFIVGHEGGRRRWHIAMSPGGTRVCEEEVERPDLEIEASEELWLKMVKGEVSPLEAFGQGKVMVRGDIELARAIARALQGT